MDPGRMASTVLPFRNLTLAVNAVLSDLIFEFADESRKPHFLFNCTNVCLCVFACVCLLGSKCIVPIESQDKQFQELGVS